MDEALARIITCWNCGKTHNNDWDDTESKKCDIEWKLKQMKHSESLNNKPENIKHDGHLFIKTGNNLMIHHPSCGCGK